jgi:hypothetical protein
LHVPAVFLYFDWLADPSSDCRTAQSRPSPCTGLRALIEYLSYATQCVIAAYAKKRHGMPASRKVESQSHGQPRRGFSRGAFAAALIAGLLIGAGATYTLAGAGLSRTSTTTTTLPGVTRTSTTTVTATQTSQAIATVASNGLGLSTSINATDIVAGQNLNISISLFNTLPTANVLEPGVSTGNWTFYGVPLATWPECSLQPHEVFFGWQFAIEVLVLKGNYTAQQLSSLANVSLPVNPCSAGVNTAAFPIYTFEPNSNMINITYFADGGAGLQPVGLFRSASQLTLDGYWNLTSLAEQANGSYISEPAVCQLCKAPSSTPFARGVYTVGVADEWGQSEVLHFQVSRSG